MMPPEARLARVIAQALDARSALGQHMAALVRLLCGAGWAVELEMQDRRAVPDELRSLLASEAPARALAKLTILEYPIWFPLAERFRTAEGAAIFWYHGVTPPALWSDTGERDLLRRSEAGAELVWHAHLAVADSPFIADELQRNSGYPAERIRIVPLGVDIESLRPPPSADLAALRHRWNLDGRQVLLYVGRVAGNKRLDLLVEALARLIPSHPDLHLLIVGDTESLPSYRDLAARLRTQAADRGIASRVTLTGQVESVAPFYALADVFALPSQHEGFGVPLVEAMAAGVPVVASASGAMPWVLGAENPGSEPHGLMTMPGDAADLAAKIALLLDDVMLRRMMVERGRQRATCFGIEQFNIRTHEVLTEAESLARSGPPLAAERHVAPLYQQADVALHDYRVRSRVPLFGPLIEWLRTNSTTHVKEAYLDRIIEQQVLFNRALVVEVEQLRSKLAQLEARLTQFDDTQNQVRGHAASPGPQEPPSEDPT